MPFSPLHLLLFLALIFGLAAMVQLGLVTLTFQRLGLSPHSAFLLLLSSLLGSAVNLPFFKIRSKVPPMAMDPFFYGLLRGARRILPGWTVVTVNVGGCLIPVAFSLYLFRNTPIGPLETLTAVAVVTAVSYHMSRPVPGVGVAMPVLVAPFTAAIASMLLGGEQSAPLAYISGSLGVLIGADLLRLRDVPSLGAPLASIGGAGTFDGIFLTGLIAVLLT